MIVHCLFEQSGTFKNEFKKLGYEAYDYDILNDYGQTDYIIDLFKEIEGGYLGEPSIFDNIAQDDLILAFFPCTYFQSYHSSWFLGRSPQHKNYTDLQKLEMVHERHIKLHNNYERFCEMCILATRKGLRLVIENPYTQPHYLTRYFPIKPKLIDSDRSKRGDKMKKQTQYWFIGMNPHNNLILEQEYNKGNHGYCDIKTIKDGKSIATQRSEIHPDYANRFIREFLIDQ